MMKNMVVCSISISISIGIRISMIALVTVAYDSLEGMPSFLNYSASCWAETSESQRHERRTGASQLHSSHITITITIMITITITTILDLLSAFHFHRLPTVRTSASPSASASSPAPAPRMSTFIRHNYVHKTTSHIVLTIYEQIVTFTFVCTSICKRNKYNKNFESIAVSAVLAVSAVSQFRSFAVKNILKDRYQL